MLFAAPKVLLYTVLKKNNDKHTVASNQIDIAFGNHALRT